MAFDPLSSILTLADTVINKLFPDKTEAEKAKVRMAVDLLKLTGDEGTLPDKVKDDPTIDDPETGISKGDLSNGGVAYGQYDGGY